MSNRILVMVSHFCPHVGGLENSVLQIYTTMRTLYPHLEVDITCNNTEGAPGSEVYRGLHVYRTDCWKLLGGRYPIPRPGSLIRTLRMLSSRDYLFVNTHTRYFIDSLIGCIYAKLRRIPFIHTEQGASFTRVRSPFIRLASYLIDQTFGRIVLSLADELVTVSTAAGAFVLRLGGRDCHLIRHGVHAGSMAFDAAHSTKAPGSIVFVGRLVYEKGAQDLLYVLKDVRPDWHLKIVGDGDYRAALVQLVQDHGLEDRVEFCGFMDPGEVHELLARSLIFVNPTYAEGFGMVTIEAGLEGCAVIASNVGGQADIVEHGVDGFLIDGYEKLEKSRFGPLRERIEQLLRDPDLCRVFGQRMQKKVLTEFTWQKAAEAYYQLARGGPSTFPS